MITRLIDNSGKLSIYISLYFMINNAIVIRIWMSSFQLTYNETFVILRLTLDRIDVFNFTPCLKSKYASSGLQKMMSSIGNISTLLALCDGNPHVTSGFPSKRPVTRSFDFSLIYAWTNGWASTREAGHSWRHRAHYDVTEMNRLCLYGTLS